MGMNEAYLDIETTGLSWIDSEITVVGIYLVSHKQKKFVQLVGEDISGPRIMDSLKNVTMIYTYNGSRFDLPFIRESTGLDPETFANHHDLMYDCWDCNLYGGLKSVERQLGICRRLQGINGLDAVMLWQKYRECNDRKALDTLLEYNREDVLNLHKLRQKLWEIREFN
jgi:uncharacterized protein